MNNLNKKYFIGSFLAHLFLFLSIFYMATDNNINKRFVVFGMHSKKPTHAYFKTIKAPTTTSSQWLQQRNIQQKKAPTKISEKKPLIKKAEQKKISKPAPTSLAKAEKKPIKKTEPKTKQTTIKKDILKDVPKKIAEPEKISPAEKEIAKPEIAEEELHFNLMGESDPNLIKYQLSIQKEVERLWHPPVGVPKGTECSICFTINSNGAINKFEFIKRSKILIYDLSISRIAKNFQFDRSLWNKKFTIDFRQ